MAQPPLWKLYIATSNMRDLWSNAPSMMIYWRTSLMTGMPPSETTSIARLRHSLATAQVVQGQGPPAKTGALSLIRKIADLQWAHAVAVLTVLLIDRRPSSAIALPLLSCLCFQMPCTSCLPTTVLVLHL